MPAFAGMTVRPSQDDGKAFAGMTVVPLRLFCDPDQRLAQGFRKLCQRAEREIGESSGPTGNLRLIASYPFRQFTLCDSVPLQDVVDLIDNPG